MSLSLFEIGAFLVGLSALFGYLNHFYLRVPHTIGLVLMALAGSLALLAIGALIPAAHVDAPHAVEVVLQRIDFHETLMHGVLSFLLFAGGLHMDLNALRRRFLTIGILSTVGVAISSALAGASVWLLAAWAGHPIPFIWALIFGALISPTDPVAVLALFRTVPVPEAVKITLAGESLFNDGVGVVLFTVILGIAVHTGAPGLLHVGELFAVEVLGGAALGLVAGYIGYRAMHRLEDPDLEVLITLAVVMVCYSVCIRLEASGPIAMVVAGLMIGNKGMKREVSEHSRDHLQKFWSLLDMVLNSVLFLLIGLEVLVIGGGRFDYWLGLAAIPIVLAARWISVFFPLEALRRWEAFGPGTVPVLTWGGLRGGIAIALALSLPDNEYRPVILHVTYVVVLFSIIVQGLTVTRLIQRVMPVGPRAQGGRGNGEIEEKTG